MPNLADLIKNGEFAKGLDTPSGNPFGRWAQGVAQRTIYPLNTLAEAAQQSIDNPMETALNWSSPMSGALAGMFAGVGAKTADVVKLGLAKQMKASGIADDVIHAKTGWFSGMPDGKWRFEIPDNASMYRGTQAGNRAGDAVHHPELFSAHPPLKDIQVREFQGDGGSLNPLGVGQMNIGVGSTNAHSTALHELQHAIQQREGFARGGSLEISGELRDELLPTIQSLQSRITDIRSGKAAGTFDELLQLESQLKPLNQQYDALTRQTPFEQYKRLAGEAEARLTQARMNMTPEQRLANYPVSQFDIPVEQQIVRYE